MDDKVYERLDDYDKALYRYVKDNVKFSSPEVIEELYSRYAGDAGVEYDIYRGMNFDFESSFNNYVDMANGSYLKDAAITSWSTSKSVASNFSVSKKIHGNNIAVSLPKGGLVGDCCSGYGGIVLHSKVDGSKGLDLSKVSFDSEAEFLVLPNVELPILGIDKLISFEERLKGADVSQKVVDLISEYDGTTDNDRKVDSFINFILENSEYKDKLNNKAVDALLTNALEKDLKELPLSFDGKEIVQEDGYKYVVALGLSSYRKQLNIMMDSGNTFFVTMERDRKSKDISYGLEAKVPENLMNLFDKGVLRGSDRPLLEKQFEPYIEDAKKLAQEFEVTKIEANLFDTLNQFAPEYATELKREIMANGAMAIKEANLKRHTVTSMSDLRDATDDFYKKFEVIFNVRDLGNKSEYVAPSPDNAEIQKASVERKSNKFKL